MGAGIDPGREDDDSGAGFEELCAVFFVTEEADFVWPRRIECGDAVEGEVRVSADELTARQLNKRLKRECEGQGGCGRGFRLLGTVGRDAGSGCDGCFREFRGRVAIGREGFGRSVLVEVLEEAGGDVGGVLGVEEEWNL